MNKKTMIGTALLVVLVGGIFTYSAVNSTRDAWAQRVVHIEKVDHANPNNPNHNEKNYLQIQDLEGSK
ncbi:MAG: hypothetical protein ACRDD2_01035 [Sarcina sp.]